jgi:hypothetical protein
LNATDAPSDDRRQSPDDDHGAVADGVLGSASLPAAPSEPAVPPVEARGRVRRVAYDRAAVELAADALRVPVGLAPFRLPGAAVYQLLVPGDDAKGRPAALLTLWPSIRRVDAVAGPATVVFTDVAHLDLVDGIEVMFRRAAGEYLIVARGGKVVVRA